VHSILAIRSDLRSAFNVLKFGGYLHTVARAPARALARRRSSMHLDVIRGVPVYFPECSQDVLLGKPTVIAAVTMLSAHSPLCGQRQLLVATDDN
jgi:hypothetical protein